MLWGLTHNPFVKQPPHEEVTRRFVFTGRDKELLKLLEAAEQGEPCCLYGTYGMGKSMLMLEARRIIKERHKSIVPLYTCIDPGLEYKDFDRVVLAGIAQELGARGVQISGEAHDTVFGLIRRWIQAGLTSDLKVFAMIDDMDRPQDVEKIPTVINTVRALRDLSCGVCLPANPNQATHKFATAGQGILDRIDLAPLQLSEYIQMVARYLETARGGLTDSINLSKPKVFLSYARFDEEKAERLYGALTSASFRPWMDKHNLLGGENWPAVIEREIPTSDFVILCLSQRSCEKRGYFRAEIGLALRKLNELLNSDIYLIPVRLEECEIPQELSHLNYIDLFVEGGLANLEKSIREGFQRRVHPKGEDIRAVTSGLKTFPFDEASIARIVDRVGGTDHLTPRMLNTACRSLLGFACDEEADRITEAFVDAMWERLGAQVLSNEGDIERCARLVRQLMEHEGTIDEDGLKFESILKILNSNHGGFADLLEVFGHFEDVFHIEDRNGNLTVLLSPLIDQDFVRNVFLKKTVEEFRQEFERAGGEDRSLDNVSLVITPTGPPTL